MRTHAKFHLLIICLVLLANNLPYQYDASAAALQVPQAGNLWVDAVNGNDANNGLTAATALRTIQKAADRAGSGTTVHILPGVYRETVWPANSGAAGQPIVFRAENGRGTVSIRGSQPSSSLTWSQLGSNTIGLPSGIDPHNIYYADLSAWELSAAPRFVIELDGGGQVAARLPLAREPDWQVTTEWKYHEFWWAADGGGTMAGCVPTPGSDRDCDAPSRSTTQLTDQTPDTTPAGIEAGSLKTLDSLAGATLVAMDTRQGHYTYRRTIVSHDKANGRVTVDESCGLGSGSSEPALGWGTKYYVEGRPSLLDTPGEWWYDSSSKRLYLWPRTSGNPGTLNIEISRRDYGFRLENRSYITLDSLTLEFFEDTAVYQISHDYSKSYHNTVRNSTLRYANYGVLMLAAGDGPAGNITDGFVLQGSEVAYLDTQAIHMRYWWGSSSTADTFTHAGITDTVIQDNELHHMGFRSDFDHAVGAAIFYADHLSFVGNYVHHAAHNGVQLIRSIIQSSKQYGFAPSEIKTGDILIKDNVFEKACLIGSDCAALKIWGATPDYHVYRNLLVTGNVFRNIFGWAYVAEKRGRWTAGSASVVKGMGGFGLYVDNASGIHAYRNIAYNNSFAGFMFYGRWRDGDIVYYNNIAANSIYGFNMGAPSYDTHGNWNTQVVNNIIVNNEGYGLLHSTASGNYGNLTTDHNLHYNNGWRPSQSGGLWKVGDLIISVGGDYEYYPTLAEIQSHTSWEDHGIEGNPRFSAYNANDHNLFDGSWPDFHPTSASDKVIGKGTTDLPASLKALLAQFAVQDQRSGSAFDIGRYETGFALLATPSAQGIEPGGVARYTLSLGPSDLTFSVALNTASPSSYLAVDLRPTTVTSRSQAILTVTDSHTGPLQPGRWYTIPITGIGGGYTQTTGLRLIVGGARAYLPVITHGAHR